MSTIVKLQVENVKRVKAVEIKPNGNLIVVGGQNSQGKTSVLDAIAMALGGANHIPSEPIRRGTKKASIILETSDLVVTRSITSKGTTLKVTGRNGALLSSPQKLLDKLVGDLSFDPLEFSRMKPQKQLEILRKLVGLDFTNLDNERKELYDERTSIGRDLKQADARLNAAAYHKDAPETEQSLVDLLKERDLREEINRKNQEQRNSLHALRSNAVALKNQINDLEKQLACKRKELDEITEKGKRTVKQVEQLKNESVEEITERISSIEETNRKVRENKEHFRLNIEHDQFKAWYQELTKKIEEVDARKADEISKAKFPIDGLALGEDGVIFNDFPLNQASSAEQLRISVAIGIALNPELKVLRIMDGSLLDKDNLKLVAEMAANDEAQVWLERVGDGDECSVIIEEGEIRN